MAVSTKDNYQMAYSDVIEGEKIFIVGGTVTILWAINHQNMKV